MVQTRTSTPRLRSLLAHLTAPRYSLGVPLGLRPPDSACLPQRRPRLPTSPRRSGDDEVLGEGHLGGERHGVHGGPVHTVDRVHTVHHTDAGCKAPIVQQDDNDPYAAARVMLTSTVDADKEDDMAQRSTALPAPATPTPTS